MIDDLEDGGLEEIEDIPEPSKEKKPLRKHVKVLLVAVIVVVAYLAIWISLPEPLRIKDLVEMYDPDYENPGFDHDLAGKSLRIEGTVTNFYESNTTQGTHTLIELDEHWFFWLIDWKRATFDLGDVIVRDIRFEWGWYNNYTAVFSPQVYEPVWEGVFDSQHSAYAKNHFTDPRFKPRYDGPSDHVIMDVLLWDTEGLPLEFYNASLRKGLGYWSTDATDIMRCYSENPELDYIESLDDMIGEQGNLRFVDGNSNGLLDTGDYFEMDLTRPSEASSIFTYLLLLNGGPCEGGILASQYLIPMNRKGSLLMAYGDLPQNQFTSEGRFELVSLAPTPEGYTAEVVVSDIWGYPWPTDSSECRLRWPGGDLDSTYLVNGGIVADDGNITISFTDVNADGILNVGDTFIIEGLSSWTKYTFKMLWLPQRMKVEWITGLGPRTNYVPMIEWDQPEALDSPANFNFKIQIENMYGVPGVPFNDSVERMVVDLKMDGNDLFSNENLTHNFSYSSTGLNITFTDADGNDIINSGDYFLCTSTGQAEFKLSLSYVNDWNSPYNSFDQPLITWPISWQTG